MDKTLRVGIDIGSTTIKMVILDDNNSIIFQQYARHFSDIIASFQTMIGKAQHVLRQKLLSIIVTGSAGMGISSSLGLPFVQEVIASTKAVRQIIPSTDTAIELGGEDAKITYFGSTVEQRMNGVCAGGTGAFIDHMAVLLHTDPQGLNELAKHYQTIYPIASRCGVFAKTDVQALMNEGVSKEDIAASVLQAVVNQTISSLSQGRTISGKVAFLGGPLSFLSELRRRFIETLGLHAEQILAPDCSAYFVAIGAALTCEQQPVPYEILQEKAPRLFKRPKPENTSLEPLFATQDEYQAFIKRHNKAVVKKGSLAHYQGKVYLGIDAGSTTTKLALIGEDASLLYSFYGSNTGKPLATVLAALQDMYSHFTDTIQLAQVTVTGYGEQLIKAALKADIGEVETVAHLTAAKHFLPEVSFVLDIGGQDMKSFFVRHGAIDSIMLNEACSSGCGSFVEAFAQALNMNAGEFAALGLTSQNPVDLGSRCTVFMNSKVKQAQKEGASVSDISAGISISIIKNALFKVIRLKDAAQLGKNIVVQGGTFYNNAVLRALEKITGKEVIRPDIAGLMGAFGAALISRSSQKDTTSFIRPEQLDTFSFTSQNHRCQLCGNHCLITTQLFSNGQSYYAGNRCEKGAGQVSPSQHLPNLYQYKYQALFHYTPLPEDKAPRGILGLPRALNLYEDYPFWFTLFTTLGYRVLISGRSSRSLYEQGMETIPSESICYPAKLVHGHISDLLQKGIRKIFYPSIPYNQKEDEAADNCYNCPIVTSYPENIKANMDVLSQDGITFYHPFLPLHHRDRLLKRLSTELAAENISKQDWGKAIDAAYAELNRYKSEIRQKGEEALQYMRQHKIKGVVLAGRPYHIDPEINHGLPELLAAYNLVVLSEDAVCHLGKVSRPLRVVDQWTYHSRLYGAASFVAANDDLELLQINSFGCGLDAVVIDQVKEILENKNRLHTVIKLDEISNLGAAKIRVRSLLAAINSSSCLAATRPPCKPSPVKMKNSLSVKRFQTILAPQLSPIHFQFLEAAFHKAGYQLKIAAHPDKSDIEEGLKYVHNDACYPSILVIGQLLRALKSNHYDLDKTAVMLAQTGGGCRATNYVALTRKALEDANMPQVPVIALGGEKQAAFPMTFSLFSNLMIGTIYGDLLMRVLYRTRPYEAIPGSAQKLFEQWSEKCCQDLLKRGKHDFHANIDGIVHDFDNIPLCEKTLKPKIGIVGEILVKYNPAANNQLISLLENEGAEAVVPDLLDFFLYCAYDGKIGYELLAGSWWNKTKGSLFIRWTEFYRYHVRKALAASKRFSSPYTIDQLAQMASRHLSLGNLTGEGWLLTAEMAELIHSGVDNIVCLQPFACLPNHITGKGMIRELRRSYPAANIVPIDYDPGASEVNQINRIKLMLAVAQEKLKQPT